MKNNNKLSAVAAAFLCLSQGAYAGAFSLYTEGSAGALGNYAAGIAAEAADASTAWYNPAGLVLLHKQQLLVSGVAVLPSTKLTGSSTFLTTEPLLPAYVQNFQGLQGSKDAAVPAMHYALPLGERAAFGFSIVAPFGLSTDYSESSEVRYAATLSDLLTMDFSPDIAGKLTDNLSLGLGLDLQIARVKYNQMLGTPTIFQFFNLNPSLLDSQSYNQGHSTGFGFHAGLLGAFNDNHSRIGLNYQSRVKHNFHGKSELKGPLADPTFANPSASFTSNNLFTNAIDLPDIATLSAYQDINDRFALMASVVYTGWSSLKTIQLNQVAAFSPDAGAVLINATSVQDYRNVFRVGVGGNYKVNEVFMLRAGGGYDQTPTVDAHRDIRLPDGNRYALSVGAHWQGFPTVGFDLGYTHLFGAEDPIVNRTDALGTSSSYNVNAKAKVHADLVGLQALWTIDQETTK